MKIPDSVTGIGASAFYGCSEILYITLGKNLNTIGNGAFSGCTGLTNFDVSDGNSYYCDNDGVLFSKDMTTLVSFPLASPILPSYDIPNSVTTIGYMAFNGCEVLNEVTIPNSVTTIGDYAFSGCSSLTSILIPNSVTTIGENAFYNCTGLIGELTIPNSVTEIGSCAFEYCRYLTSIVMGNSVEIIWAYAFQYCTRLTSINISEALTAIRPAMFYHCESLTSIIIPDNVKSIQGSAFYGCTSLNTITIGKNVETILVYAFSYCESLRSIYIFTPIPPPCELNNGEDVFRGVDKENCVLYVPSGSKSMYSTADTWQDFLNIVEMTEFAVETLAATEITDSSAILNGSVTEGYDEPVSKRGFEYWKEGSENVVTTINLDENDMSYTLEDLAPATTYIYRAFATTEGRTTYGEDVAFTTLIKPATVETQDATNITEYSATLNGIIEEGSEEIFKKGFEYWKAGSENIVTTINLDENEMSYTLNDLSPATTYFYHAFATTESGTIFGEDVSFNTLDDPSGIVGIYSDSIEVDGIYSTSGQKLNSPVKGINIVKYPDGSTKKVLVK